MRSPLRLAKAPHGPRLYIGPQRIHHGAAGLLGALLLSRLHRPLPALFLILWALTDRKDLSYWFYPGDPQTRNERNI